MVHLPTHLIKVNVYYVCFCRTLSVWDGGFMASVELYWYFVVLGSTVNIPALLLGGLQGGLHITDVTNASRTLLMNLSTLSWDPTLLKSVSMFCTNTCNLVIRHKIVFSESTKTYCQKFEAPRKFMEEWWF